MINGWSEHAELKRLLKKHDPGSLNAILEARIHVIETYLRTYFPGYDESPTCAQDALLDIALDLGIPGLESQFPELMDAFSAKNWEKCAELSYREGHSPSRNDDTAKLFRAAIS